MKTTTINNIPLTPNELAVMTVCTMTEFEGGSPWNWAVQSVSGIKETSYGGVVSSLIKKGLCQIDDAEGHGHPNDMVFVLTQLGKEVNRLIHAQATPVAETTPEPVADVIPETPAAEDAPKPEQVIDVIKMSVRGLRRPMGTEGLESIALNARCFFIVPGEGDALPTLISSTGQRYDIKEHSKRPSVLYGENASKKGQYAGQFMKFVDGTLTALPK